MRLLISLFVLLCAAPATAQPVISIGLDGGVTHYQTDVESLSRGPEEQEGVGVSLGLEMLNFMWAFDPFMVGVTLEGSFFQAGPEPSPGMEFMFGPRVAWRAHDWLHLQTSGGVLMSAFNERCGGSFDPPICDEPTRPSEGVGVGFGVTFSPMVPFEFEAFTLLVGPTIRHRRASYDYEAGGEQFRLRTWQFVLGAQFMTPL